MAESKAGYVLSLIGGILGIVFSLGYLVLFLVVLNNSSEMPDFSVPLLVILLVYGIVSAVLTIWGGTLMKEPRTTKKGGIIALVFSVIGMGTILGFIGGIIGIVEGSKNKDNN